MADKTQESQGKHTAGLLDIRNIIGGLLLAYGVILLAMGLFADPEYDKTGDVNANLFAGIALLVAGGFFVVWVRLRPIVVPEDVDTEENSELGRPPGH